MTKATRVEFGDFQTPPDLAAEICARLESLGLLPSSIFEPSVGLGNLLVAALTQFRGVSTAVGIEINPEYAGIAASRVRSPVGTASTSVEIADFFDYDLESLAAKLPEPILVVGNPPWVTNSMLARLGSTNLPAKANFKGLTGIAAITGRSNFDLAEWFLLRLTSAFRNKQATVALLCKNSVARTALAHLWRASLARPRARMFRIDAQASFNASVDACLLVLEFGVAADTEDICEVFAGLSSECAEGAFGRVDGRLVSDARQYARHAHLATSSRGHWRSGLKHDCAPVMELKKTADGLVNGAGAAVCLEPSLLYPLLKSTQVFHGTTSATDRAVIVTQQRVGEETNSISHVAPLTWKYLNAHADRLDARKSSIYRGKPRFSVFGVGDYSFAPWKVCVSGLHKELRFRTVGPINGKPTIVDDTVYFLPAYSQEAAESLRALLESPEAFEFLHSLIFWDSKRPVTVEVLSALDLDKLAAHLGKPGPTKSRWLLAPNETDACQSELFAAVAT